MKPQDSTFEEGNHLTKFNWLLWVPCCFQGCTVTWRENKKQSDAKSNLSETNMERDTGPLQEEYSLQFSFQLLIKKTESEETWRKCGRDPFQKQMGTWHASQIGKKLHKRLMRLADLAICSSDFRHSTEVLQGDLGMWCIHRPYRY